MAQPHPCEFAREVQLRTTGRDGSPQDWLVFSRAVDSLVGANPSRILRLELAFRMAERDQQGRPQMQALTESPLVVFFPTTRMTNLGFVVQGPFRTTPTRETVPVDEPFNKKLVCETADLAVEALRWFRAQGILDAAVLRAMPVNRERFPPSSMFRPIFDRVLEAMRTEELVPAKASGSDLPDYVDATRARTTRWAEIEELLEGESLPRFEVAGEPLRWVSRAITADPLLIDYLERDMLIRQVAPAHFIDGLTVDFLSAQPHEWLGRLYAFLGSVKEWRLQLRLNPTSLPLASKSIVRLASGAHVPPLKQDGRPAAFLPAEGHTGVSVVEPATLVTEEALSFFKALRYELADEYAAVCELVLPSYQDTRPFGGSDEYLTDLQQVLRVHRSLSQDRRDELRRKLDRATFIWAVNASTGNEELVRAGETYFETPELRSYFEGNAKVWFLHSALKKYAEPLAELDVAAQVRINVRAPDDSGYVPVSRHRADHQRGIDGFDPGFRIEGLDHAVAAPNEQRSAYIWNNLLRGRAKQIRGLVESSRRRTYEGARKEERWSEAGNTLRRAAWLPVATGRFCRPGEISLGELPDCFVRDNDLARQLGMRIPIQEASAELAARLNVAPDVLEVLRRNSISGAELEEFLSWKRARSKVGESSRGEDGHPESERERAKPSPGRNDDDAPGDESTSQRHTRSGLAASGDRTGERAGSSGAGKSESSARPHPEEGIRAQEWLRSKLCELLGASVAVSAGEESLLGESGRSDIILRSDVSEAALYIEVKRIEGRKVYWSKDQIGIARRHPGSYFIALLSPVDGGYSVNWVWDPLRDFLVAERKVQWTWQVQATGTFGADWRPAECAPAREADGFKAVIQISTEMLGAFTPGLDAIRSRAVEMGLLPTNPQSAVTGVRSLNS